METIDLVIGEITIKFNKRRFLDEGVIEFLEHVPEELIEECLPRFNKVINPIEQPEVLHDHKDSMVIQ